MVTQIIGKWSAGYDTIPLAIRGWSYHPALVLQCFGRAEAVQNGTCE